MPTPANPIHVLLVDDDPAIRHLLRRFLEQAGHTVLAAENGADAVALAIAPPRPAIVLMDLDMPVLDGLHAGEAIRQAERDLGLDPVPVVAVTAHAFPEVRARSREAGMTDFLPKPVYRAPLLDVVGRVAENSATPPLATDDGPQPVLMDEDLIDLVRPFLERQRSELDRVAGAVDGELEDLRLVGHRLRGTAGSFGLLHLSSLGALIEGRALAQDMAGARQAAREARRHLGSLQVLPRVAR